jgi:hypothetical protein
MAGQPIRRQLHVDIVEKGGLPYVLGEIAKGRTMTQLAKEFGVGLWSMDRWVYRHTKGTTLLADARKVAAGQMAAEVLDIAEAAYPENERVARLQIDSRKWLAAKLDPAGYGEQQASAAIQINVGDMHLLALRQVQSGAGGVAVDVAQAHQVIDATPAPAALPAPAGVTAVTEKDEPEIVIDDTDDEYDALEAVWAQEAQKLRSTAAMRAQGAQWAQEQDSQKILTPRAEKTEARGPVPECTPGPMLEKTEARGPMLEKTEARGHRLEKTEAQVLLESMLEKTEAELLLESML